MSRSKRYRQALDAIDREKLYELTEAIGVLNRVLASEIVCVLRYKRHFYMATGINAEPVAQEFLQHANDEQLHADQVAMRITQLGGEPDFDPRSL